MLSRSSDPLISRRCTIMATNAWVDWGTLPYEIRRDVAKRAMSGPGSWGHTANDPSASGFSIGGVPGGTYFANRDANWHNRINAGESFHPNADRTTPMERAKYAAMTALAVGTVGLGLASWQSTPKDERSKANTIASPEPTAKAINAKSEL